MFEVIKDGACYCQDEGAIEASCGICPVHPLPPSEQRTVTRRLIAMAYNDGRESALVEMRDAATAALSRMSL